MKMYPYFSSTTSLCRNLCKVDYTEGLFNQTTQKVSTAAGASAQGLWLRGWSADRAQASNVSHRTNISNTAELLQNTIERKPHIGCKSSLLHELGRRGCLAHRARWWGSKVLQQHPAHSSAQTRLAPITADQDVESRCRFLFCMQSDLYFVLQRVKQVECLLAELSTAKRGRQEGHNTLCVESMLPKHLTVCSWSAMHLPLHDV